MSEMYPRLAPSRLLRGRARGGPRDGVVLEATRDWSGRVRDPESGHQAIAPNGRRVLAGDHPGHYEWRACDDGAEDGYATWVWVPDLPPEIQVTGL